MLLDTASLYFRAFYGVPDTFTAPDGTPVNAVRGLLDFISRLVGEYHPTHLACCWDNDWRPQWRVDLLPSYKAHRVGSARAEGAGGARLEEVPDPLETQIPVILEVLAAFGIAVVGADGYEADDVIGTLATGAGMPVDIVTGDRDLFQLVDDDAEVRVLYVARGVGRHERVTNAVVREKYGVDASPVRRLRDPPRRRLRRAAGGGRGGGQDRGDAAATGSGTSTVSGPRPTTPTPTWPRARAARSSRPPTTSTSRRRSSRSPVTSTSARRTSLLPLTPVDPESLTALAERWGLDSPAARLVQTLTSLTARVSARRSDARRLHARQAMVRLVCDSAARRDAAARRSASARSPPAPCSPHHARPASGRVWIGS